MEAKLIDFLTAGLEAGHTLHSLRQLCRTYPRHFDSSLQYFPIEDIEWDGDLKNFVDPRHANYGAEGAIKAAKERNGEGGLVDGIKL